MVKKLIQHFDTHPNRDSLVEDLNNSEEFNQFSEKSKELISSMGGTEYFELCESSSYIQRPDCSWNWDVGIVNCARGKCLQPSERNRQLNKDRYDVLSIPSHVIKKNPSHGRCGNTPIAPQQQVRQRPNQQFEGHEVYSYRRDTAFVFISVIMVATERQLVVNVELGLFIMEWTLFLIVPDETFYLLEI